MNNYILVAIALCALGAIIILKIDTLITADNTNVYLKQIRDNNTIVGALAIGAGLYAYTLSQNNNNNTLPPSYETSTEEALKL